MIDIIKPFLARTLKENYWPHIIEPEDRLLEFLGF